MTAEKTEKVDNGNFEGKLALRRYFMRKYHADGQARVFDCCQGSAKLWTALRREFQIESYWGVDFKKKAGRLQIDSARILAQPGWREDVIDIDTYGSPWKHWDGVLANSRHSCTVFLTLGQAFFGTDRRVLEALGVQGLKLPPALRLKLQPLAVSSLLTRGCVSGTIPIEALEVVSTARTRYIGVRLEVGAGLGEQPAADA